MAKHNKGPVELFTPDEHAFMAQWFGRSRPPMPEASTSKRPVL